MVTFAVYLLENTISVLSKVGAFLTCPKKMTNARGGWERLELTETLF